ncbi:AraC family transcriptional regulator [Acerihabitans sp.]|uniref:helix-turn-helix domain-containing protein n=1 Tax=Acerihabitans sp. TaxID=2811394 RepID=UPI002EDACF08
MSVAAFYRHFKLITAMTPIQYQKRLCRLKARWLLLFDPRRAASIAFRVGYESASGFSRELPGDKHEFNKRRRGSPFCQNNYHNNLLG